MVPNILVVYIFLCGRVYLVLTFYTSMHDLILLQIYEYSFLGEIFMTIRTEKFLFRVFTNGSVYEYILGLLFFM